jgi:hypothetical protein
MFSGLGILMAERCDVVEAGRCVGYLVKGVRGLGMERRKWRSGLGGVRV